MIFSKMCSNSTWDYSSHAAYVEVFYSERNRKKLFLDIRYIEQSRVWYRRGSFMNKVLVLGQFKKLNLLAGVDTV